MNETVLKQQRIEELYRFVNSFAKSGWIREEVIMAEIARLIDAPAGTMDERQSA